MSIRIEVSFGELIDKITILEIKQERVLEAAKTINIERELAVLNGAWRDCNVDHESVNEQRVQLKSINVTLWGIEDEIRRKEAAQVFDADFIDLARSVYRTNDERSVVKRTINERLESALIEEKSYQPY